MKTDRRRLKALALVGAGTAGAALLIVAQQAGPTRRPTRLVEADASIASATPTPTPTPTTPVSTAEIHSFALRKERRDVTSAKPGPIEKDGEVDWMFDLHVTGAVAGIVLTYAEADGRPVPRGRRWATIDVDPALPERSSYGPPSEHVWQLAVSDGSRIVNDANGVLPALAQGTHRLVLHASTALLMLPWEDRIYLGGHLRVYVVGPNREVTPGPTIFIDSDPAPPGTLPSFDRSAAANALAAISVEHCAKLAGVEPTGRAEITFKPDGSATAAVIEGMDPKSAAARCVSKAFERARVPAFGGAPIHVKKSFTL